MINVRGLDHVVLRVAELERSLRFYEDVLGARVERVQDAIGLYQLRLGDCLVDLVPVQGKLGRMGGAAPGPAGRNVDHICFRVLPWDGDAVLAHLALHGIEAEIVSRYGAQGEGPSVYLADPDGNGIELKGPPWPPERPREG
ncbi:MAG TPA: VOC family protein [Allosphingosinicella sp.]|jgi:catechol 2,3-dioxygenase-like lactoylglutathione lyase family enzyme